MKSEPIINFTAAMKRMDAGGPIITPNNTKLTVMLLTAISRIATG